MEKKILRFAFIFVFTFICSIGFAQESPDALKMYRNGQYQQAIETCLNEIKVTPGNLDSYVVLTWALVASQQYEKAIKWSEEGRKIAKNDPRLLETLAEAHFYLGNNEISLKLFREYILYAPNGYKIPVVYYFMGEIFLRMEKFHHADISFSVAVNLNSEKSMWWARLGYVREQTKEYRYALEAYEQALALNKNLIDAQKGKERVLRFF